MGLFERIFKSREGREETKVRRSNNDRSITRGDKIKASSDGSRDHRWYKKDDATGSYKEGWTGKGFKRSREK